MKFAPLAAFGLAIAAITTPAFADDSAATSATATVAALTVESPIEALMADERAKAVVDKHLPGIDQHPSYEDFKSLSLKSLAPFSQGLITEDVLAKIATDLAAIQ